MLRTTAWTPSATATLLASALDILGPSIEMANTLRASWSGGTSALECLQGHFAICPGWSLRLVEDLPSEMCIGELSEA